MRVLRQYWKTASMTAAGAVGDNPLFLLDYLLRFARVALMLSIWRTLLAGRGAVSGMTLATVLTYALIAEAFAEVLTCRTNVEGAFWDGSIGSRFLRPVGLFGQFAAEAGGRWGFNFLLFSLPLLAAAPLLGVNPLPANPAAALWFVLSLALAGLAIEFSFGALAVIFQLNVYAINRVREAVGALLSGAVIPLTLLPWGLGVVFDWLPFASVASAPLRIYTATGNPLRLVPLQLLWSLLLWPVARRLWRASQERMVVYGG